MADQERWEDGMSREASETAGREAVARRYNVRLGMVLFLVYLVLYSAFVLINALVPVWMEWRPLGGLNLALISGFGLILVAILLAMFYGLFSRVAATGDRR